MAKKPSAEMDILGLGFIAELIEPIPVKIRYNTGLCLDLVTGRFVKGRYGDMVMNGGISPYTGIVGGPNMGKSTWMDSQLLILNDRYGVPGISHNNEADAQPERWRDISKYIAPSIYNFDEDMRKHPSLRALDLSAYTSQDMHEEIRKLAAEREKRRKELMIDTPFIDEDTKEVIQIIRPLSYAQDSLSQWQPNTVTTKISENEIGSKKAQMFGMMHGMSKTQMVGEIPTFCNRAGMIVFQTAHLGTKYSLDPYAPKRKKLEFMASDIEIKFVSNNFTYLPNNLWWVMGNAPMLKKAGDGKYYPEFPDGEAKIAKDTDLTVMMLSNLRGKSGPSGIPFEICMSQAGGLIPYLTNYRFCSESDLGDSLGYGISGSDKYSTLDLYPDVKFNRFNLRPIAEQDPRMQRAIRFTADLCMLHERLKNFPRALLCSPAELYADIAKAWDWNELLDTRDYWTWDHYSNPVRYLSIYDLLNMRAGLYVPYWKQT